MVYPSEFFIYIFETSHFTIHDMRRRDIVYDARRRDNFPP